MSDAARPNLFMLDRSGPFTPFCSWVWTMCTEKVWLGAFRLGSSSLAAPPEPGAGWLDAAGSLIKASNDAKLWLVMRLFCAQLKLHIKGTVKGCQVLATTISSANVTVRVKFSALIESGGHFSQRRRSNSWGCRRDDLALAANAESPGSIGVRGSCCFTPQCSRLPAISPRGDTNQRHASCSAGGTFPTAPRAAQAKAASLHQQKSWQECIIGEEQFPIEKVKSWSFSGVSTNAQPPK